MHKQRKLETIFVDGLRSANNNWATTHDREFRSRDVFLSATALPVVLFLPLDDGERERERTTRALSATTGRRRTVFLFVHRHLRESILTLACRHDMFCRRGREVNTSWHLPRQRFIYLVRLSDFSPERVDPG